MSIAHTIEDLIDMAKSNDLENLVLVMPKKYKGISVIVESGLPEDSVFITEEESFYKNKKNHLRYILSNE